MRIRSPFLFLAAVLLPAVLSAQLRISEFLPDPAKVPDAAGEWIELENTGGDSLSLEDWRLVVASDSLALGSGRVAPGGVWVLGHTDMAGNGGAPVDRIESAGWSLGNAQGRLLLLRLGVPQDSALWFSSRSGASWERCGTSWIPCPLAYGAGDRGTPGSANSCDTARRAVEGAVASLEPDGAGGALVRVANRGLEAWSGRLLLLDPGDTPPDSQFLTLAPGDTAMIAWRPAGIPDRRHLRAVLEFDARPADDARGLWLMTESGEVRISEVQAGETGGAPEWVEIAQVAGEALTLGGWSLGDSGLRAVFPEGTVLGASGFLVASPDCDALRSAFALPDLACVEPSGWARLATNADRVELLDQDGNARDALAWSREFWGAWPDSFAMARRDFFRPSDDPANWEPSGGPRGGTPGWRGEAAVGWTGGDSTGERVFRAQGRTLISGAREADERMCLQLRAPRGEKVVVTVHDLGRRRIRRLLAGSVPRSGILEWDGRDEARRPVPPGPVVLVAEFGSPVSERRKLWVVVAPRR